MGNCLDINRSKSSCVEPNSKSIRMWLSLRSNTSLTPLSHESRIIATHEEKRFMAVKIRQL